MGYELVSFKGMGDGVKIRLDAESSIYNILEELERKINSSKAFFGDGNCNIRFDGRQFTLNEKRALKDLMCRLLPLCNVTFASEEKKSTPSNDWIVEYKEKHEKNMHPEEQVTEHKKTREIKDDEFISMFRSNRARLFQGVVNEGVTLRSDGHLILLGKAEKGSELIAVGNILVVGGLYGKAHAGCNGHNGSYILAMDMKPEKFRKKDGEEPVEIPGETECPAVALLKNNKITLDNFTIKTFTNLKNMV